MKYEREVIIFVSKQNDSLMSRNKNFKLKKEEIKQLIKPMGGCIATDAITVENLKVKYMTRMEPENDADSGWLFQSGTETQEYMDDADNMAVYDVNTIANYDPSIIPYLESPIGSEFMRLVGTNQFKKLE